ncbi:MAG: enoyl-CoA hydratase-related protein, partial [Pseudomonadota bacterium]
SGERMEEKVLLVERKERICTLTLNRPEKRNALSPLLLLKLTEVLRRLTEEDEVRCVVIRGTGEKAFSSGFDISDLPISAGTEETDPVKAESPLDQGMQAVIDFPYPVIAMVNGPAFGAGCELAMTCDIRIAADHARFSVPPAKLGIVYRWRGILKFIDMVGLATAKEMFFTGRVYDASQAKEMGLIHYVLPRNRLTSFTFEMAQEISENAPLSLRALKIIFNRCQQVQRMGAEDIRQMEALRDQAFRSEDVKEGRQAFREKRKPVFKGR